MGAPSITQAECDRIKRLVELGKPRHYIRAVTKRSYKAIQQVVDRGFTPFPRELRPVPDGFADDCRVLAINVLAKKYGAAKRTVNAWIAKVDPDRPNRKFVKGRRPVNKVPVPEGFREFYEANGWVAAMRKYGVSGGRVHRWVQQTGGAIAPRRNVKPEPKPANDITAPPPGYEQFKRKLGSVRSLYEAAA